MREKLNYVLYSLILAIVGTALWEFCFRSLLTNTFDKLLDFCESLSTSYVDYLYKSASLGLHEYPSVLIVMFFFFFLACIDIFCAFSIFSKARTIKGALYSMEHATTPITSKDDEKPSNISQDTYSSSSLKKEVAGMKHDMRKIFRQSILTLVFCVICIMFSLIFAISIYAINSIQATALRSIEIISPYVSDFEYKQFKSSFYLMDSRDDYDTLMDSISAIAQKENIQLE